MSDRAGLTFEERQEIDTFYERLGVGTHYELLGVPADADPDAIRHAYNARTRRFHPRSFSGQIPASYRQRIEAILAAFDEANSVLGDPVRRFLYDQELASRPAPGSAASTKPAAYDAAKRTPLPSNQSSPRNKHTSGSLSSPSSSPRPDANDPLAPTDGHARSTRAKALFTDIVTPSKVTPTMPYNAPTNHGAPHALSPERPIRPLKDTGSQVASPVSEGPARPGFRLPTPPQGSRGAAIPISPVPPSPPVEGPATTDANDARVHALEGHIVTLQAEVSTLLTEVERLAVSVQLAIAYSLEPDGVRPEQLVSAGQALVSTRVAVATLLARREENAGRWESAAVFWQRAARARPGEVLLLVRAADALRKANADLDAAEALARQAIQIDPDCAEAHAALAVIESRRRTST